MDEVLEGKLPLDVKGNIGIIKTILSCQQEKILNIHLEWQRRRGIQKQKKTKYAISFLIKVC